METFFKREDEHTIVDNDIVQVGKPKSVFLKQFQNLLSSGSYPADANTTDKDFVGIKTTTQHDGAKIKSIAKVALFGKVENAKDN